MRNVVLTVGIPASGKTTWAIAEARKTGAMIVCRDDVRRMLGLGWNEQEDKVTQLCYAAIFGLLSEGFDIIVADTNINPRNRAQLTAFCVDSGAATVDLKHFPISTEEAVFRDASREASVGTNVILNMQKSYTRQF